MVFNQFTILFKIKCQKNVNRMWISPYLGIDPIGIFLAPINQINI